MHFLEYGVIKKKAPYKVGLVYPNVYKAGNSNLGFMFAYNIINEHEKFQCERIFTDFRKSIETHSILRDFDIIAFSCSFEMDYFSVYEIAQSVPDTVKILGGRTSYNPFPLQDIIDFVFVGDAEKSLPRFLDQWSQGNRSAIDIPGVFTKENPETCAGHVKLEYHPLYQPVQWGDYPEAFARSFLLEMSRGCSQKCKFCLVSHCMGKKRERPVDQIQHIVEEAEKRTRFETVCLIGPDSHSRITEVVEACEPYRVSLPSLRAKEINTELLEKVSPETVTIAPETSERLRFKLGKPISDEDILEKVALCSELASWIKLYFMVGLPGETEKDLDAIVTLVKDISRIMRTRVTVTPFIPKPHTPFSECVYDIGSVEKALNFLRKRIQFSGGSARNGFIQWVLSVGDERITPYLNTKKYSAWKKLEPDQWEKKWEVITV
jgi:radical SAM superfamily enzyme YgiQ (UPF0313 family)